MSLLSLQQLEVSYGGIRAVKGIDLEVGPGERVCLIGANGAGKTTTLKAVTGLVRPASGKIVYDGQDIGGRRVHEIARRGLAIVGTFSIQDHPAGILAGDARNPQIQRKLHEVRGRVSETWRSILTSGVQVAVGTDSMHGCLAFDIMRLTAFGAPPARALRAATVDAAAVCDRPDRGTIAPGMRADLVGVLGNPLDDIRVMARPVFVMKAGAIVHSLERADARAAQTEVAREHA